MNQPMNPNPWQALRAFTNARIALGRSGDSLPTNEVLAFGLAHAQARDAVHAALDIPLLQQQLASAGYDSLNVHSAASDRHQYLCRPDLGRQLDQRSRTLLASYAHQHPKPPHIVFVIADGLSALAAQRHALPLLQALEVLMATTAAPVVIARQSRVALGDDIGALLQAQVVVMLIGERPGLSSPDSLGVYLTYKPQPGRTDADRNCISNIRPQGLSYPAAAHTLCYLLQQALNRGVSGVMLKDEQEDNAVGWVGEVNPSSV
jgi:ethanolamine ammonia-lyase small subunit